MAYDGYHPSSNPYDQMGYMNQPNNPGSSSNNNDISYHDTRPPPYPPYPSPYAPDQINMPQPQMPSVPSSGLSPEPYRNPNVPQPPQRPWHGNINDAVNSAFHKSDTPAYVSPDLISKITANVIQQLKVSGLDSGLQGNNQPPPPQPPPQPQPQWTSAASNPPYYAYTEPQLHSSSHYATTASSPSVATDNVNYRQPSTTRGDISSHYPTSKPSSDSPSERPNSTSTQGEERGHRESRPSPPNREVTELTTLEKIWGRLFEDEKPTERLGQFLRGVAVHLIEDYPPGNTIVVVPDKMQKFYKDTDIASDPYPWQDIFDDRTSSISRMYREVRAEHHLVQDSDLKMRPDIPGLTPRGYQRWATLMILAHPDREHERFAKAVLDMPISNPDDKRERFPKEIPRRLFPDTPDLRIRQWLDECIVTHCAVDVPGITPEERAKVSANSSITSSDVPKSPPPSFKEPGPFSEQERRPPFPEVADEEEEDPESVPIPPQPIERQRKPYTAHPGGGKVYGEAGTARRGHGHAPSSSTSTGYDDTADFPPADYHSPDAPYPLVSPGLHHPKHRRRRSPSFGAGKSYTHSESDLAGHDRYAGSRQPVPPRSGIPGDTMEDSNSRRHRDHSERRWEDARLHNLFRERGRERERSRHRHEHGHGRPIRSPDEDHYAGMLGRQAGSPVDSGNGYNYKTYTYR